MASIASNDALILPHRANPLRWDFRERQPLRPDRANQLNLFRPFRAAFLDACLRENPHGHAAMGTPPAFDLARAAPSIFCVELNIVGRHFRRDVRSQAAAVSWFVWAGRYRRVLVCGGSRNLFAQIQDVSPTLSGRSCAHGVRRALGLPSPRANAARTRAEGRGA
jgi:hypothetical protein